MDSDKNTARIVGVLFLTALFISIIGSNFISGPIMNAPDYLSNIYPNTFRMSIGMLFELINAAAVLGIGFMLAPILKRYSERIAFGYLGCRIIESATAFITAISIPLLIALSQEFIKAGAPDTSYYQTLGIILLAEHHWAFEMVMIACALGGLLLCYLLYRYKLVPRFLSILGLTGYALLLAAVLLGIFGFNQEGIFMVLYIPGSLFEIIFPIWLIVKGFNSSAITMTR